MKKETIKNDESTERSLQDYLSLGYLYLLVLGIFKDAIFYGHLGVNILNYSNIQDILLSPIIYLTSNIKQFLVIFVGIPLISYVIQYAAKKYHKKNKNKEWYKAKKNYEKWDKTYGEENSYSYLMVLILFCLFGGFIGFGLGRGQKMAQQLEAGTLKNNHQITFTDASTLEVNMIGHNSEYIFYVAEKDTTVTIMPIQGNIKKIQNLE